MSRYSRMDDQGKELVKKLEGTNMLGHNVIAVYMVISPVFLATYPVLSLFAKNGVVFQ